MKISRAGVGRFLESPDAKVRAALLYGPNTSFVHEAAQRLARQSLSTSADDPYAMIKLAEDDIKRDPARLADGLAAQSLLGGVNLVWARVDGRGADAALLDALKAIETGASTNFLIVEAGDISSTGELTKAFNAAERAAAIAFYEESEAERAQYVKSFLRELGLALDADAEERLLSALPSDRGLARREVEKLALYAHGLGRKLTGDDFAQLLPDESESALDAASSAAASGKPAEAIEALARIDNLSGVSALRALERRMLQLSDARALIEHGASPSDAVAKLRPPVFWKERDAVAAQTRAWSAKKLNAAFDILWNAELRAKTAGAPQHLIAADAFRAVAGLIGA